MNRVPEQCSSCGRPRGRGHICPRICPKCGKEYAATLCPKCWPALSIPEGSHELEKDWDGGLPPPIDRDG